MTGEAAWRPTQKDPLFILAMDHRDSFGKLLFGVQDDHPTGDQLKQEKAAKELIFAGLQRAAAELRVGTAGVLVDEELGQAVIDRARDARVVLAVPLEASGHEWFTLEHGPDWLEAVRRIKPDYAKVLVRDNPSFDSDQRTNQLARLAEVSAGLHEEGIPLLYELLVPATDEQLDGVGGDVDRYDRDVRPELVVQVIADNQRAGVEPTLWKVEGLDTPEAAAEVAAQVKAGGRDADLIVLGRDAPVERLDHWLEVASAVEAFVGFAIGRSIWEDVIAAHTAGDVDDDEAAAQIAGRYLGFVDHWRRVS